MADYLSWDDVREILREQRRREEVIEQLIEQWRHSPDGMLIYKDADGNIIDMHLHPYVPHDRVYVLTDVQSLITGPGPLPSPWSPNVVRP